MLDQLDAISRELLARLTTENSRPADTPGTHLVGGLVKSGVKLEALLRVVVELVAAEDGISPNKVVALAGGRAVPIRKAMAGQLAHGLKLYLRPRRGPTLPREFAPLVRDLTGRDSKVLRFINARNEVAKQEFDPEHGRVAMRELAQLITAFRSRAGWE